MVSGIICPSVTAGILKPSDLAGYRNEQVYIKVSMYTPLNSSAVRDAVPVLFDLLKDETEPGVYAVLGHATLERASVEKDIADFVKFIAGLKEV
jgi:hypothetical protein